jgi:hypothetical protein
MDHGLSMKLDLARVKNRHVNHSYSIHGKYDLTTIRASLRNNKILNITSKIKFTLHIVPK